MCQDDAVQTEKAAVFSTAAAVVFDSSKHFCSTTENKRVSNFSTDFEHLTAAIWGSLAAQRLRCFHLDLAENPLLCRQSRYSLFVEEAQWSRRALIAIR